jgi:hypothetical protein
MPSETKRHFGEQRPAPSVESVEGANDILKGGSGLRRAALELAGKTATGIVVPDDVVERLGAGERVPVRATIRRHVYHTSRVWVRR